MSINAISLYSHFGVQNITQSQAASYGVTNDQYTTLDTDGDGYLSMTEILADESLCEQISAMMLAQNQPVEPQQEKETV